MHAPIRAMNSSFTWWVRRKKVRVETERYYNQSCKGRQMSVSSESVSSIPEECSSNYDWTKCRFPTRNHWHKSHFQRYHLFCCLHRWMKFIVQYHSSHYRYQLPPDPIFHLFSSCQYSQYDEMQRHDIVKKRCRVRLTYLSHNSKNTSGALDTGYGPRLAVL